ncbi:transglycosylase domain-containing protein [Paenibacillus sp. GCM10023252]|uniref:transglycosylase domain-containing protein n=1 Tax=Paenibacillus sp. GCM10023252 TaxID=3252649 RepID=UPI00362217EB
MRIAAVHSNKKLDPKRKFNFKKAAIIAGAAAGIAIIGGLVTFRVLVAAQDVKQLEKPLPAATIVYDQQGRESSRVSLNNIEVIPYADIPKHMIDAVIAVEDKRYFEHDGMDMRAISRAFYTNLTAGGTVQGGSTITQQLAKNVFLSHERTWSRKWNEVLLATKIEENYSKDEIMELYLNQIYFGEGAWGIKRAAKTYFGKPVQELTVAESALLAGLIKAPSALTPYKHLEKAQERRNLVLGLMKEQELIGDVEYSKATKEPVNLLESRPNRIDEMNYPYYIDLVIREAITKYGLTESEVLHGGLRIYTALNSKMQKAAESVYANSSLFPQSKDDQLLQSGAVLVDPRDGGIRAIVGGRGKQPFRSLNRGVQLKRQPGSTMKPIAVYAPALEKGYRPDDTIVDEPVNFGGYAPKNAGGAYHGEVTLYEALIHSYNVPAVKLLNEIGISEGMESAKRFGIPLVDGDRTLGLALGGLQEGVAPVHMAEAFGAFANDGVRNESYSIVRIESADGTLLAERKEAKTTEVMDSSVARTMTAMMTGVTKEGTGTAAAVDGREIAGKSGTTEMAGTGGRGAKDNWFVGYTPQLVTAVWLGYDQTDSNHYLTTSSKAAAIVFQALMAASLEGEPVMKFPVVPGFISDKKKSERKSDKEDNDKQDRQKHEDKQDKKRDKHKRDDEEDNDNDEGNNDNKKDRGKGRGKKED